MLLDCYVAARSIEMVVKSDGGVVSSRPTRINDKLAEVMVPYQKSFIPAIRLILPVAKETPSGHAVPVPECSNCEARSDLEARLHFHGKLRRGTTHIHGAPCCLPLRC